VILLAEHCQLKTENFSMNLLLPLLLIATTALAMETNQAPATLPGSAWQVTTFAGQTPLADHPITFEFDTEGNIAGDASCNRFGGTCTIEGNTLEVGPLRSTRRACEPEVMQQEHKFLALLGAITTWSLEGDDLVFTAPEGVIKAKRQAAAE
jgi:heat shock protein HslJ